MKGMQTRSGTLKRKRRSSDLCYNIENEPVQDEKKLKEERNCQGEDEADATTNADERMPLSELSVLRLASTSHYDFERDSASSPESLIAYSPWKEASSPLSLKDEIIMNKAGNARIMFKNNEISFNHFKKYTANDCKVILHWPTVLHKFDSKNRMKWLSYYNCLKADMHERCVDIFDDHPGLQPRFRAVLLEWLIEVCDVFKLHRETYYLAMDYIDRYLFLTSNVPKVKLQLIGISCLLIACKIEEIYPPKVGEFAFVTDGACSENDILAMEVSVIKILEWKFKCISSNCWLIIYLQLGYMCIRKEKKLDYLHPLYPPELYTVAAQLLDLATLDIHSLNFQYNILAISALYIICSGKFPLTISGYEFDDIKECVRWMEAFWSAVYDHKKKDDPNYEPVLPPPKRTVTDVSHYLQQHAVSIELLECAQANVERLMHPSPSSLNLLTPPSSSKKSGGSEVHQID